MSSASRNLRVVGSLSSKRWNLWTMMLLSTGATLAQSSESFRLDEHVLNAGGRPAAGVVAASASFAISVDAIGSVAGRIGLVGASFSMDGGFVAGYPPPGEVAALRFADAVTLSWEAERAAGVYHLYRAALGGGALPACHESGITGTSTLDVDVPSAAEGFYYLLTVENTLDEEGTAGHDSGGVERQTAAGCP